MGVELYGEENMAHRLDGKRWYADTAFMNAVEPVAKSMFDYSEMKHMGFGEFYLLVIDNGKEMRLDFDRMRGKDFEGQSGRSHWAHDDQNGKLVDKIMKVMERKGKSVRVARDKTAARTISEIAAEIAEDWGSKVNFAAKPYLRAMFTLRDVDDMYGADSADMIVRYFLVNARSWRGPVAKSVKVELKKMLDSGRRASILRVASRYQESLS